MCEAPDAVIADNSETNELPSIDAILAEPSASFWLKAALGPALCRDPVDAANDSEILARRLDDGASTDCRKTVDRTLQREASRSSRSSVADLARLDPPKNSTAPMSL
jgi:hypothetical protein